MMHRSILRYSELAISGGKPRGVVAAKDLTSAVYAAEELEETSKLLATVVPNMTAKQVEELRTVLAKENKGQDSSMVSVDFQTKSKLAPTGRLRVGIAVGDAISAVWTKRDPATGQPRGPTVDLAQIFSERIGLPLTLVEYGSSGEIIEAASSGNWDVSFTPVDDERKAIVDFGPNFALGESTYMVAKGSAILNLSDVDRSGVRVFGVENTATIRSSRRSLKNITAVGLASFSEVLEKFRGGQADAIALGKESLLSILPEFPGARILDGNFLASGTAVAVPRGNAVALKVFSELLEELKANGTIRKVFDKHGMTSSTVAPPGSRS